MSQPTQALTQFVHAGSATFSRVTLVEHPLDPNTHENWVFASFTALPMASKFYQDSSSPKIDSLCLQIQPLPPWPGWYPPYAQAICLGLPSKPQAVPSRSSCPCTHPVLLWFMATLQTQTCRHSTIRTRQLHRSFWSLAGNAVALPGLGSPLTSPGLGLHPVVEPHAPCSDHKHAHCILPGPLALPPSFPSSH